VFLFSPPWRWPHEWPKQVGGSNTEGQAPGDPMHFDCYWPLCSPLAHSFSRCATWTKCSILLTEMSWKSPGFIKWWPRCLYQCGQGLSHQECVMRFQMPACMYHTQYCLPAPDQIGFLLNGSVGGYIIHYIHTLKCSCWTSYIWLMHRTLKI
jgi:hypothetical protein